MAVQPVGVKFCSMVDLSSRHSIRTQLLPFGGDISGGRQMPDQKKEEVGILASRKPLTANISKMVSQSVTCQLGLHQLEGTLLKCIIMGP